MLAQVGSLFSSDAWNNITFTAGEVRDPRRNIPLSLFFGTALVITLYFLANVAYLCVLPLEKIQHAPDDRVGTAAMEVMFGGAGAGIMAVAIMISTFGCCNGLILAGARVYYAMAQDGLFFKATARLNSKHVPAIALVLQGIWTAVLVLPRTRNVDAATSGAVTYGNLYSNLLDYIIFAALIFYVLTIAGIFRAPSNSARRGASVSRVRLPDSAGALHGRRHDHNDCSACLQNSNHVAGSADCPDRRACLFPLEQITRSQDRRR